MDDGIWGAGLVWSDVGAILTDEEVARVLRISRNACYETVRTGEFPSERFGRGILIPKA